MRERTAGTAETMTAPTGRMITTAGVTGRTATTAGIATTLTATRVRARVATEEVDTTVETKVRGTLSRTEPKETRVLEIMAEAMGSHALDILEQTENAATDNA